MKSAILAALAILATSVVAADATSRSHVTVYKTPSCGCCEAWSKALEKAGYDVERHDMEDLSDVRRLETVPAGVEGCHTAALDGYFLEGHVPLAAIRKLQKERPQIAGLAVPGMPAGSLGMGEHTSARYVVVSVDKSGEVRPFPDIGE